MKKQRISYINEQAGSTAIEFSLIAVAFLTILFGIMEAGRIFWTQNSMQYAIENASRAAIVDDSLGEGDIIDVAIESLSDMSISGDGFDATVIELTEDGVTYIEIDATYQYSALISAFLPDSLSNITLEAFTRRPLIWGQE